MDFVIFFKFVEFIMACTFLFLYAFLSENKNYWISADFKIEMNFLLSFRGWILIYKIFVGLANGFCQF